MAKLLQSGGNLLLLDEPTNDLDVDTLRALEDALLEFAGCAVVISHDRWFLDRIATHILAFEGDSQVVFFEGNYGTTRRTCTSASAPTPTRRTASVQTARPLTEAAVRETRGGGSFTARRRFAYACGSARGSALR